jgi:hypothetical protein
MTADVVAFPGKLAKQSRWGPPIPFTASMGLFDGRLPVRGPETLIRPCRQQLNALEARGRRDGHMDAGNVHGLQSFVLGYLFHMVNGYSLPE